MSQAQQCLNYFGARGDLAEFLDSQRNIERDDCPLGSRVCWFFTDGSIIWHDFETGWEVIDGKSSIRGVGA